MQPSQKIVPKIADNRPVVQKVWLITLGLNLFVMVLKNVGIAHEITEAVEARLEEKYSPVRVTIHVEPPEYISEEISYESGDRTQ